MNFPAFSPFDQHARVSSTPFIASARNGLIRASGVMVEFDGAIATFTPDEEDALVALIASDIAAFDRVLVSSETHLRGQHHHGQLRGVPEAPGMKGYLWTWSYWWPIFLGFLLFLFLELALR